jgi:hypothetical protein
VKNHKGLKEKVKEQPIENNEKYIHCMQTSGQRKIEQERKRTQRERERERMPGAAVYSTRTYFSASKLFNGKSDVSKPRGISPNAKKISKYKLHKEREEIFIRYYTILFTYVHSVIHLFVIFILFQFHYPLSIIE